MNESGDDYASASPQKLHVRAWTQLLFDIDAQHKKKNEEEAVEATE